MKITIDLRSALVGLLAGVAVALTLGATTETPREVGRYQVSAGAYHGLLVDTVTGRVWSANLNEVRLATDGDFKKPKQ